MRDMNAHAEDDCRILHIAGYRFTALDDLPAWRARFIDLCTGLRLRGTILLATEGINLFLAGAPQQVDALLAALDGAGFEPFAHLNVQRSWSAEEPFRRLRVRIKREIIRMNRPAVAPAHGRAPALDSTTLRRWLDQGHDDDGHPVLMLDTRNAFEVDHGAFDGALDWRIGKFSDFPSAAAAHRADLQGHTIVSYCTGGIRCEKAALWLREAGHDRVWQLDGGILQYLRDTGGAHWHGRCFVFDERVALDEQLSPAAPTARPT